MEHHHSDHFAHYMAAFATAIKTLFVPSIDYHSTLCLASTTITLTVCASGVFADVVTWIDGRDAPAPPHYPQICTSNTIILHFMIFMRCLCVNSTPQPLACLAPTLSCIINTTLAGVSIKALIATPGWHNR